MLFHDDQHGTAIIATAGLMNAAEITGKSLEDMVVVVNGAGAAGISCARMFIKAGVRKENLIMLDSKGVIYKGRDNLTPEKAELASDTEARTLAEAVKGADVFMGLSVAGCLKKEMLQSMNSDPIVFAMANPDPEITYEDAVSARPDVIMATGLFIRSRPSPLSIVCSSSMYAGVSVPCAQYWRMSSTELQ